MPDISGILRVWHFEEIKKNVSGLPSFMFQSCHVTLRFSLAVIFLFFQVNALLFSD